MQHSLNLFSNQFIFYRFEFLLYCSPFVKLGLSWNYEFSGFMSKRRKKMSPSGSVRTFDLESGGRDLSHAVLLGFIVVYLCSFVCFNYRKARILRCSNLRLKSMIEPYNPLVAQLVVPRMIRMDQLHRTRHRFQLCL